MRWIGPLVTVLVIAGIGLILWLNLEPAQERKARKPAAGRSQPEPIKAIGAPFVEHPIGDEVERNHIRIVAVWLPSVEVEGQTVKTGSDVIHLEADVRSTAGNPNGFAKGEFIPYLKITYRIEPVKGGTPVEGTMSPMVAADGPHYGANVSMPRPGTYRLTYHIEPPSAGGLGRHHDPLTGVAPWWAPFDATFDWDFDRSEAEPAPADPAPVRQ